MTTTPTPPATHAVAYATRKRPHGLAPLTQWQCAHCGRVGPWIDKDTAHEQGVRHERSGQ